MERRKRKRQIILFLTAILLPAALLVGLAVRVIRQEKELTEKRIEQDKRDALDQLRRELSNKLEAVKLQEAARLRDQPMSIDLRRPDDSTVVFVLPLEQDHLVLPWQEKAKRPLFP